MKLLSILILSFVLAGCGAVNDKYDGLIVMDGNGKKYALKHNFLDTYFIREVDNSLSAQDWVQEANSKLAKENK